MIFNLGMNTVLKGLQVVFTGGFAARSEVL